MLAADPLSATLGELWALVGAGGAVGGGGVMVLGKLLLNSLAKQLDDRFRGYDEKFATLEKTITATDADRKAELASMVAERKADQARFDSITAQLFSEIRNLSNQVSFMNGQLYSRGLVSHPPPVLPAVKEL